MFNSHFSVNFINGICHAIYIIDIYIRNGISRASAPDR